MCLQNPARRYCVYGTVSDDHGMTDSGCVLWSRSRGRLPGYGEKKRYHALGSWRFDMADQMLGDGTEIMLASRPGHRLTKLQEITRGHQK